MTVGNDTPEHCRRQFQIPRQDGSGPAPTVVVHWVPPGPQDCDPVERYAAQGAMCVGGRPLNAYLADAIEHTLERWREIPAAADPMREFITAKQQCLNAIRQGHAAVLQPGVDASYITLAAALCANAVRTVTVLSTAAMPAPGSGPANRAGPAEFKLSRHFAGLTRYRADMLPRSMLPFGAGRRLAAVKREAVKDLRLIANVFACEVDALDAALTRAKLKLRAPLRETYIHGAAG